MRQMTSLAVAAACLVATSAYAYAVNPAAVIAARQANYKQIHKSYKAIGDELKKPAPSVAVLRANARTIHGLSVQVQRWFPAGTGPEAGVKTKALPAIWEQNPRFRATAGNFVRSAQILNQAAASGNLARVRPAAAGLGEACKVCHQSFRAR